MYAALDVALHGAKFALIFCPAEGYLVFESVKYPGQRVGILPDGSAKRPSETGTGDHARFTPKVIQEVRMQIQYDGKSTVYRCIMFLTISIRLVKIVITVVHFGAAYIYVTVKVE